MDDLIITLVQTNLHWEDKEKNLRLFDTRLREIENTDLIILPEMFATGFSMNPVNNFEEPEGKCLEWMKSKAYEYDAAICGSLIVKEGKEYFNRLHFVLPSGEFHIYDKRHLFTLAGEQKEYSGGRKRLYVKYKGWAILPFVCYDLRFPVWCRNVEEAELMIFVANWPERRSEAWKTLLKARAIENMCYVAGVNRVGFDGNQVYHSGDSGLYDELGNKISDIQAGHEGLESYTISKKQVHKSRERFSFLKDRDAFEIKV